MDNKVKTHEVLEFLVVVSHHGTVVARVVEGQVLFHHSVLKLAAVDKCGNFRHLGDYVQDVFVRVLPVLLSFKHEDTEQETKHTKNHKEPITKTSHMRVCSPTTTCALTNTKHPQLFFDKSYMIRTSQKL